MATTTPTPVIDFSRYIEERTQDFTGREWVFEAISRWLVRPDAAQTFLLRADPGGGKTAVAARLVQFGQGRARPPDGAPGCGSGILSAAHFCSARDRRWVDPRVFARSMAGQLAATVPGFAEALIESSSDGRITVKVEQRIREVHGRVTGVAISRLDVGRVPPDETFNALVREPLESVLNDAPGDPVVLLVDALDEAERWSGEVSIGTLLVDAAHLPAGVRLILTARTGTDVFPPGWPMEIEERSLTRGGNLGRGLDDVRQYVLNFHDHRPEFGRNLVPGLPREAFADAVRDKCKGNFLYVKNLLEMLATQRGRVSKDSLDYLPDSLNGIYLDFLDRLVTVGKKPWDTRIEPLLGTLAVAQEALTRDQLRNFTAVPNASLVETLRRLRQVLDADDALPAKKRTYAIYHRSFADFLLDEGRDRYVCDATRRHERIAAHYSGADPGRDDGWDQYGLRYAALHLTEAARGRRGRARREHVKRLLSIVLDPNYLQVHLREASDPAALLRDLEAALGLAAADLETPTQVAEAALTLVAIRGEPGRSRTVFEVARMGNVDGAQRRLDLFDVDSEWKQVALLAIAWLAAARRPGPARALYHRVVDERIAGSIPDAGALPILRDRVYAALTGAPSPPPPVLGPVPAKVLERAIFRAARWREVNAPDKEDTRTLLDNTEDLWSFEAFPEHWSFEASPAEQAPFASGYEQSLNVTATDAAALVANAVAEPAYGTPLVHQYLAALALNRYSVYRNRFLWPFLTSVLAHPDSGWVRDRLAEVVEVALSGSSLEFQERLPLTIAALVAAAGSPRAAAALEERRRQAEVEVTRLQQRSGASDTWGSHKRRLAALAEGYALAVTGNAAVARDLLDRALRVPYGYAGFEAPACLALAEAIRVCGWNGAALSDALRAALKAAHNVQEPTFCARTTARVDAMIGRWWQRPLTDAAGTIEWFVVDPFAPEFTALHRVGNRYAHRASGAFNIPLPDWVLGANTLASLARVYGFPLEALQRANAQQGWSSDQPLPPGAPVNVPDTQFAPLLAARFAAELVTGLPARRPSRQAVTLLQRLVPIAVANPTALDTVLSRLLLAAPPSDPGAFDWPRRLHGTSWFWLPVIGWLEDR